MKVADYFTQSKINIKFDAWLTQMADEIGDQSAEEELQRNLDLWKIPGMKERCKHAYDTHKHGTFKQSCLHTVWKLRDCGEYAITRGHNEDIRQNDVVCINYCQQRYCALCEMKKSRKRSLRFKYKFQQAIDSNEYDFFFLTLTVPNVSNGFRQAFETMRKAYFNMLCSWGWAKGNKQKYDIFPGVYGQFEVTIDKEGNYHPHLHSIIAIRKSDIISYRETRTGFCKCLEFYNNKCKTDRTILDNKLISKQWKIYCRQEDPVLFIDNKDDGYIVKCCKCTGLEHIHELTKYLTNFYNIRTREQFITYCRDSYKLRDTISRGILGFKSDDEPVFDAWIKAKKNTDDGLPSISENLYSEELQIIHRRKISRQKGSSFNFYYIYEKNQYSNFADDVKPWKTDKQTIFGACSPGDCYNKVNEPAYEWESSYHIIQKYFNYSLSYENKMELLRTEHINKIIESNFTKEIFEQIKFEEDEMYG